MFGIRMAGMGKEKCLSGRVSRLCRPHVRGGVDGELCLPRSTHKWSCSWKRRRMEEGGQLSVVKESGGRTR